MVILEDQNLTLLKKLISRNGHDLQDAASLFRSKHSAIRSCQESFNFSILIV